MCDQESKLVRRASGNLHSLKPLQRSGLQGTLGILPIRGSEMAEVPLLASVGCNYVAEFLNFAEEPTLPQ